MTDHADVSFRQRMRLLVITHMFPPCRYPNGKRPAQVVRAALAAGWQVDVVTSRLGVSDGEPECVSHPGLRILRRSDPVERFCRLFARHDRLFRAVSLAVNGVLWPDEYVLWSLGALRSDRPGAGYDRVLASVLPASLLLGGTGAGRMDLRWVLDYQEPVTPFYARQPRRSLWHRWMLPRLRALEARSLRRVGRVIFTSDTNQRAYVEEGLVEARRTVHIPYFYDPAEFDEAGPVPPDRFEIAYLGTFDWRGARRPETFLRSLAAFLQRHPEARPQTRFVFHGPWLSEHDRYIEELALQDVVSLNPPLPHEAYLRRLQQSTVLLLVVSSFHSLFMPSKLVDYLGAGRPILSFAPADSEVRRVLKEAGMEGWASGEEDVAGGAAALERLWLLHRSGGRGSPSSAAAWWSSPVQLKRYLDVLALGAQVS